MKILKIKEENNEFFIDLNDLSDIYDIDKAKYYSLEEKGKALILKIFDENNNLIVPKGGYNEQR